MLRCADQSDGAGDLQSDDERQQALHMAPSQQPKTHHAFNPDAPVFVSSKALKGEDSQKTLDSTPQHISTDTASAHSKGSVLHTRSTASEPASPKIAANIPAHHSQTSSSPQQKQRAAERPDESQSSALDVSATASQRTSRAATSTETDDAAPAQATSAQTSSPLWLTAGNYRTALTGLLLTACSLTQ